MSHKANFHFVEKLKYGMLKSTSFLLTICTNYFYFVLGSFEFKMHTDNAKIIRDDNFDSYFDFKCLCTTLGNNYCLLSIMLAKNLSRVFPIRTM